MTNLAILLAAYNGAKFLREQLLSIQNQNYKDWRLYVLDDGSTDNTLDILHEFREQWGEEKIEVRSEPNKGCTAAFLTLACDPAIQADYYAYCDHDDIWEADKLERAISILKQDKENIPQLYCSSTKLIDATGKPIGHSIIYSQAPSFQNAIVQNIASGNTMVFNRATKNLIASAGMVKVPIHDWWTYLLVTACGGEVYYDTLSFIQYRQHQKNLIGYSQSSLKADISRIFKKNTHNFHDWSTLHVQALLGIKNKLTPQAKITLQAFVNSRTGNCLHRLYWLYKSGTYRLTRTSTLKLYIACLLKNFRI